MLEIKIREFGGQNPYISIISLLFMDQTFQMKYILIIDGKIPSNGQWIIRYALFIENKFINS